MLRCFIGFCLRSTARFVLFVGGWRFHTELSPEVRKGVIIAAPHTSNWDGWWGLVVRIGYVYHYHLRVAFKKELFNTPFAPIFRALGAIPVDRKAKSGVGGSSLVTTVVDYMNRQEDMYFVILPEGTRNHTNRWRTGFYHIAVEAGVPIIPGYMDFQKKEVGLMAAFFPTGDIAADTAHLQGLYRNVVPKYPAKTTLFQPAPPPEERGFAVATDTEEQVSLQPYTTFGVPAQAKCLLTTFETGEQLEHVLRGVVKNHKKWLILGQGSNVLFTKDFPGTVIHFIATGIDVLRNWEDPDHVLLRVGASCDWQKLVQYAVDRGYGGLENLAYIPGSVGAAPVQNIGAYGCEVSQVVRDVIAHKLAGDCEERVFTNEECAFGYRTSHFKQHPGQYLITHVTFRLTKKPQYHLEYAGLKQELADMHVLSPSLVAIMEAVRRVRARKLPDPKVLGNAGSFFKNPFITPKKLAELQQKHPDLRGYPQPDGQVKVAAAWLIEQCGWKGKRRGDAGVHEEHALVLVNYGEATGQELFDLAKDIQQSVKKRFGVVLEPEVTIL